MGKEVNKKQDKPQKATSEQEVKGQTECPKCKKLVDHNGSYAKCECKYEFCPKCKQYIQRYPELGDMLRIIKIVLLLEKSEYVIQVSLFLLLQSKSMSLYSSSSFDSPSLLTLLSFDSLNISRLYFVLNMFRSYIQKDNQQSLYYKILSPSYGHHSADFLISVCTFLLDYCSNLQDTISLLQKQRQFIYSGCQCFPMCNVCKLSPFIEKESDLTKQDIEMQNKVKA